MKDNEQIHQSVASSWYSQSCFVLASFWPLLDWKTGNLVVKGVRLGARCKIRVTVVPSQDDEL